MIFRALDASGDWVFGKGGQSYAAQEKAIDLNIKTRILSILNDCFWQMDFGIDWWNLLGEKNPQAQAAIILAVRSMIGESYGVVRINTVTAKVDTARRLTVEWNIDTIYTRNVQGSVQPS